jgi:glycosyltransferase involved in cell wall biosynthesis
MDAPRSVTFLLPGSGHIPVGGFKVVYEYAQGLAENGFGVRVVHAAMASSETTAVGRVRSFLGYYRRSVTGFRPTRWFSFRKPVTLAWVRRLNTGALRGAEVVVATSWQTAEWLAEARLPSCRRRLYLIQHDETWSGTFERVRATWTLPLTKIVIARWLQEIAHSQGQEAVLIPNGLDFTAFGLDAPIDQRREPEAVMLCHPAKWKGTAVGLESLKLARASIPLLRATLFGTGAAPGGLPSWCRYARNPGQGVLRRLYNRASVVVCPSLEEGWGLVGSEAMICGAAVAATDIGGHREYAHHQETALLCPPGDAPALAEMIVRLLSDSELRVRLATRAQAEIRQFTWERAVRRFEEVVRIGS